MAKARYDNKPLGHFGLNLDDYCHFTSPIRRYPDLQIHRIIKENLRGRLNAERIAHYQEILPEVAEHSSKTERRADEAERDTDKMKKAEYMQQHIGKEYEGVISSITSWGMYVELPNTIEGLVRVTSLTDDYYYYDEEHYEMRAMRWSAQILERFTNSVRASVYVCLMLIKKMQQLILCLQLFGDKSETGGKIWEQNP